MSESAKELQLQTGPYHTTFVGTEISRASSENEWRNYGEILKRVDEAKQWAIGDWLVDGKRHYGDGLYKEAGRILGLEYQYLSQCKNLSERFQIIDRSINLSWRHHYEVTSIKQVEELEDGKLQESKEPDKEKIRELLALAEKKDLSVKDLRDQVKQYKRQQIEHLRLANEPEKYSVIYADPPWKYNDTCEKGAIQAKGADKHYPLMSVNEICKLPVKKRVTENAVLFMWVTSPMLRECWPVIESWGFEYKASFVWNKVKHNYGHYNSVRHELLLICTKGSYLPETSELYDSVQTIEKTEKHSQKPEEFREIIEKLYPQGKRIELFARGEVPEHWAKWGDEA